MKDRAREAGTQGQQVGRQQGRAGQGRAETFEKFRGLSEAYGIEVKERAL